MAVCSEGDPYRHAKARKRNRILLGCLVVGGIWAVAILFVGSAEEISGVASLLLAGMAAYLIHQIGRHAAKEAELTSERQKLEVEVSRRREAEQRATGTLERLDRAQRVAGIGSIEVALDTGRVSWSASACAIFGVDPTAVQPTRQYILDRVHPDDREKVARAIGDTGSSGAPAPPLEYRIIRPDGTERVVYRDNAIECDRDGRPVSRVVTFKDVTELRTVEDRLCEMMDNLDRAQRLAHLGSYIRNRNGAGQWTAEVYRIFGVDPKHFTPDMESFLELVIPEDRAEIIAAHNLMDQGICPEPFEYRIRRPSGEIRHIHRITELIRDRNGNVTGAGGTLWDITELRAAEERQRELEQQLLHSQKLEALGTLAGGIAHDLNNTLVPILSLAKLALEDVPAGSSLHADLATIIGASERARDLVKRILAFSRQQEISKSEIDTAAVVRRALQMLRATMPASITLVDEIDDVPPILADAGQLQQVVVNLVSNAAQAIGAAHGSIRVQVSVHHNKRSTRRWVRIHVADTGCGIREGIVDRIFEPFFTTKEVGEGTGLGLSVVHGIVTGHGGTIEVASEVGQGTAFTILLPAMNFPAVEREAIAA